jgi:long-chain acyl-CoA synthetase
MVIGESSIEFVEVMFAALSAGMPVVPLHPRYPKGEVERAVEVARPQLIVSTDETSAELARGLGVEHLTATALFAESGDAIVPPVDLEPDHPALLMFTSGTAGHPRIAVLSHGNIATSIEHSVASAPNRALREQIVLGVIPLTHVLGVVSVVGVAVSVGSTVVLTSKVDVDSIAELVEQHQVTFLIAPPVFWYRLATSQIKPGRLASVRIAFSGAAPLSGSVAQQIQQNFQLNIRQGYGLTEASPGLTSAVGTDAPATSVGRPLPGVKLRLVDEFGDDALIGDVGEVWAKGDNIFAGYLNDDAATNAVIDADGWLHTGDLAVVDENGYLFIVGRNKDQIIVSGFNVHPGEVEERLVQHVTVSEAAVVGEPDREYGEVVVAYVVADRGASPDPDVLEAHCRVQLAGYKVPKRFEIVDELPRGLTGKVRRRVLRG